MGIDSSSPHGDYALNSNSLSLNLYQISKLADLSSQADAFILATVTFFAKNAGQSGLDLTIIALGDDKGNSIDSYSTANGSVLVEGANQVPEPCSVLLLGFSLATVAGLKRREKTMN